MRSLFLTYAKIQEQTKSEKIICKPDWEIVCIWNSLRNIELPILQNPSYIIAWWDVMLSRNIGFYSKKQWYDRIFKEW